MDNTRLGKINDRIKESYLITYAVARGNGYIYDHFTFGGAIQDQWVYDIYVVSEEVHIYRVRFFDFFLSFWFCSWMGSYQGSYHARGAGTPNVRTWTGLVSPFLSYQ